MPPVTFRIYLLCDILTNWQGVILKFSLGGGGGEEEEEGRTLPFSRGMVSGNLQKLPTK